MDTKRLKTYREYYDDTYKVSRSTIFHLIQILFNQFESTGKVTKIEGVQIVLDKTILHPQGGGQPMDYGSIVSKDGKTVFEISDLKC